jgi:hypothetical protein
MNEETAVELLKLAVQISAPQFKTPASGIPNTDKVLGETLDVLVKHLKELKQIVV